MDWIPPGGVRFRAPCSANKLAKLRRHAQKTLWEKALWKRHFGKGHFGKRHFQKLDFWKNYSENRILEEEKNENRIGSAMLYSDQQGHIWISKVVSDMGRCQRHLRV